MLLVEDFDGDLDQTLVIARNIRSRIANAGLDLGDGIRDAGEHSGAVLGCNQNPNGLNFFFLSLRPLNVNDAVLIDHQLDDVLAPFVVYDDALAKRNIPNDILAAQRITASSTHRQKIIDAFDDDRVLAQADKFFNGFHPAFDPRFLSLFRVELGKFLSAQKLGENIAGQCFSVSDRGKQIFRPAKTVFIRDTLHLSVVIDKLFW